MANRKDLLGEIYDELQFKAGYLVDLNRVSENATSHKYQRRIAYLESKITLMQAEVARLKDKIALSEDTESLVSRKASVKLDIQILNILAKLAGSPYDQTCTVRGTRVRILKSSVVKRSNKVKSLGVGNMSLQELMTWVRANMLAIASGDNDRLAVLTDEYVNGRRRL